MTPTLIVIAYFAIGIIGFFCFWRFMDVDTDVPDDVFMGVMILILWPAVIAAVAMAGLYLSFFIIAESLINNRKCKKKRCRHG